MFDLVVVCGPTASGKSEIGLKIAKQFNGEIVCADSMQIYNEMNIGTAKPTEQEMLQVKHHLFGFLPVSQEYNVSEYVLDACTCIDDIISRNKLPVLVGGTGLYIDSLINNIDFQKIDNTSEIRKKIKSMYEQFGSEYLYSKLMEIDPLAAESIHINNVKRVSRALEINLSTGKTLAQVNAESVRERRYKPLFIGINYQNRDTLYERIDNRVDLMLQLGLVEEAKHIYQMELSNTAVGAIGYKELFAHFRGELSFEQSVELLKQKTRNYAKRQITWFKRNTEINWFYPDLFEDKDELLTAILNTVKEVRGEN